MPNDDFVELDTAPRIGHNQPSLSELLSEETAPLRARRDELLGSFERAPSAIADEATSSRVADLVRLIAAAVKSTNAWHTGRKEPVLTTGRLIDAQKNGIVDPLDRAKRALEQRLTDYQRRKADDERRAREAEARRQAEEAERQRREAAAAEAAAATDDDLDAAIAAEAAARQAATDAARAQKAVEVSAAELSRTRGELGSVASLNTFTDFADLDRATLDLDALRPYLPMDALEKAVRAFIKSGGRRLRGVRIFENAKTRVR